LTLYDPHRASSLRQGNEHRGWHELARMLGPGSDQPWMRRGGAGLAIVLPPTASPLVASLLDQVRARYPEVLVVYLASAPPVARWEGSRRAFGRVVDPQHRFEDADVVVALDADFLASHPMSARYSRKLADGRRIGSPS